MHCTPLAQSSVRSYKSVVSCTSWAQLWFDCRRARIAFIARLNRILSFACCVDNNFTEFVILRAIYNVSSASLLSMAILCLLLIWIEISNEKSILQIFERKSVNIMDWEWKRSPKLIDRKKKRRLNLVQTKKDSNYMSFIWVGDAIWFLVFIRFSSYLTIDRCFLFDGSEIGIEYVIYDIYSISLFLEPFHTTFEVCYRFIRWLLYMWNCESVGAITAL